MAVPASLSDVPDVTPYIQYVATGGQTVFPYPFPITQDSDLVVVINGATQVTDSSYSVSGVGNDTGGSITLNTGATSGDVITLYRDITIERITQIGQNSGYSSELFNFEFNNIYLILQQLETAIDQCLRIPNTNNPTPVTLLGASYANKYLAFDTNGNPEPADLTSSGTLTASILGGLLNPITSVEATAGTTPASLVYPYGNAWRYCPTADGVTDNTAGLNAIASLVGNWFFPAGIYTTTTGVAPVDSCVLTGVGVYWWQDRGHNPDANHASTIKYTGVGGTNSYIVKLARVAVGVHPDAMADESTTVRGCGLVGMTLDGNALAWFGLYAARAGFGNQYRRILVTGTLKFSIWANECYNSHWQEIFSSFNYGAGPTFGRDIFGWGQSLSSVDNMDLFLCESQNDGCSGSFNETPAVTTGSITALSTTLTVASATGADIGTPLRIAGAGAAGAALNTFITAVSGTTLTIAVAASTTVVAAAVTIQRDFYGYGIGLWVDRACNVNNCLTDWSDGHGIVIAPRAGPGDFRNFWVEHGCSNTVPADGGAVVSGRSSQCWNLRIHARNTNDWWAGASGHDKIHNIIGGAPTGYPPYIWISSALDPVTGLKIEPFEPLDLDSIENFTGIKSEIYGLECRNIPGHLQSASFWTGCFPKYGDTEGLNITGLSTLYAAATATGDKSGRDGSNKMLLADAIECARINAGITKIDVTGLTTTDFTMSGKGITRELTFDGGGTGAFTNSTSTTISLWITYTQARLIFQNLTISNTRLENSKVLFTSVTLTPTNDGTSQAAVRLIASELHCDTSPMNCNAMVTSKRGYQLEDGSKVFCKSSDMSNFSAGLAVYMRNGADCFKTGQALAITDCTFETGGQGNVFTPTKIYSSGGTLTFA